MNSKNYTIKELINNPSFRRMVRGTANSEEIDFWSNWIEESEENRKIAKKAIAVIIGIKFIDHPNDSIPDVDEEWSRLYRSTIGKSDHKKKNYSSNKKLGLQWIYRIAAIFLMGSIFGIGIWMAYQDNLIRSNKNRKTISWKTVATQTEEQKVLTFSNAARIILNSNTKLSYYLGINNSQPIQVHLQSGEAFFSNEVIKEKKRTFTVMIPGGLVKDIGTQFVVQVKKDTSIVILQDGSIGIENSKKDGQDKEYHLSKGEKVILDKSHVLKIEHVNPTFYTAWATGFLKFDRTTVKKFAHYVNNRYGFQVRIANNHLANETIDGGVYFRSLKGLLRSVSKAIQAPVYQSSDKDTVYIGNPK